MFIFLLDLLGTGALPEEAMTDPLEKSNSMKIKRFEKPDRFSCYVYLAEDSVYCARAHTSKSFMDINSAVAKGETPYKPFEPVNPKQAYIAKSAEIDKSTTVSITHYYCTFSNLISFLLDWT